MDRLILIFKMVRVHLNIQLSVPVENYLSDPEEQNAPENFMGFDLIMKLQPTVSVHCKRLLKPLKSGLMVNDRILAVTSANQFSHLKI